MGNTEGVDDVREQKGLLGGRLAISKAHVTAAAAVPVMAAGAETGAIKRDLMAWEQTGFPQWANMKNGRAKEGLPADTKTKPNGSRDQIMMADQ